MDHCYSTHNKLLNIYRHKILTMDTLISDLYTLIDNHLSDVEDVFVNYQTHVKTKNAKVATRTKNWKAILYYVYRTNFDDMILRKIYFTACLIGDIKIMRAFAWNEFYICYGFKYLVKGRHYDLLDLFYQNLLTDNKDANLFVTIMISIGLIINGDIELLKSNKYGNLTQALQSDSGIVHSILYEFAYKLFKHQRQQSIKIPKGVYLPGYYCTFGDIRAGKYSELSEDVRLAISENCIAMEKLFQHGTDQDIDIQMSLKPDSLELTALAKSGRLDRFKEYVHKGYATNEQGLDATIAIDNLELFKFYYTTDQDYSTLISKCVYNNAICILKFLLDSNPKTAIQILTEHMELVQNTVDNKIIKMLEDEICSGRKVDGLEQPKEFKPYNGDAAMFKAMVFGGVINA